MIENLEKLNSASAEKAEAMLTNCCGSQKWARQMNAARPFSTVENLLETAAEIWRNLDAEDWLEAFSCHPRIGEKKAAAKQARQSAEWSHGEQSGVANADEIIINSLDKANRLYDEKFGYTFIVCATGKSAAEMLALCEARLKNEAADEVSIAAAEQNKITEIRLKKLLESTSI